MTGIGVVNGTGGITGPGFATGTATRAFREQQTVAAAHTIFTRSDKPFDGEGTEVMLVAEPGFTKPGWLGVPFRFQVPPLDKVSRTATHSEAGFVVLGGADGPRERSRSEGPKLRTVQFKAVFMSWQPDFAVWVPDLYEPQLAAAELEALSLEGIKFRLRIRNAHLYDYDDVNMIATCTQANVDEEAGEQDSRYINLSFQEWGVTPAEARAAQGGLGPWTFKPSRTGKDSLYSLSTKYYKSAVLWKLIVQANPLLSRIPPTSTALYNAMGGQAIRIPAKPGEPATTAIRLP